MKPLLRMSGYNREELKIIISAVRDAYLTESAKMERRPLAREVRILEDTIVLQ
jgi:hypothetical protein